MTWPLWLGLLLAVAAAGVSAYGCNRWADAMRVLTRRLEAARLDDRARSASPVRFDSRELEGLPLWDARVTMLPGLAARVVDSYIAGSGLLQAAILGLVTVA
jgi:hypothetical protein